MPIRRPAAIAFAAGLVVVVGGTAGLLLTRHPAPALRPVAAGASALPAPTGPIVAPPQPADLAPVARPVMLTIPLIGVKTNLITLGLASGGAMQVPSSVTVAGWYTGSPRPGSIGSSVIVGHVDSTTARGVFYRLSELKPGDDVFVKRADGTTAEFRVTEVKQYLKDEFPTQAVYGPTPDAELRLITCGGAFDAATHHYLSNVVVYATAVKLAGTMTPQERYEDLVDELTGLDGVTPPPGGSGFGRGALRYHRKIFAMFVRGQLVVKLPATRVDELVAGGHGERFDANKGTPMREWFSLDPGSALPWPPLAREALGFAITQARGR